jgi:hypothetical protein
VDAVALAATIGGSLVALAGVGVTAWGINQQRESAKDLARSQHEHERKMAQGERLFDRRAAAYEAMLAFVQVWWERIVDTEPILRLAGTPDPPAPPTPDEWRPMYVRLRTFGSQPVATLYEDFTRGAQAFFAQVGVMQAARRQPGTVEEPWRELEAARERVKETYDAMELLVSDELASL